MKALSKLQPMRAMIIITFESFALRAGHLVRVSSVNGFIL